MLLMVAEHITGVVVESVLHRENLALDADTVPTSWQFLIDNSAYRHSTEAVKADTFEDAAMHIPE